MTVRRRIIEGLRLGLGVALLVAIPPGLGAQDRPTLPGLEAAFDVGYLLQDRNGDGHVDFVAAGLVVGDAPTDAEVAAAANVAARLGFETSAMNLPMSGGEDQFRIAIGDGALARLGIDRRQLGVDLEPGIGVVALVDGGRTVAVTGGDGAGTNAAALALAARAPYLWDPEGATFAEPLAAVRALLDPDTAGSVQVRVPRIVVEDGRAGLRRLDLDVVVPGDALPRAAAALRRIADAAAAERPAAADPDSVPGPSLRFPNVRLVRIHLSAAGVEPAVLHVVNPEPLAEIRQGGRTGGGDKDDLDLSNLYTNDGLLGDSDNNLIPDRVDAMVSAAGDSAGATAELAARLALESTGATLPLAVAPEAVGDPERRPPLVLVGRAHPLVERLVEESRLRLPDLEPGEGRIQVVHDAFDERTAVVIVGGDAAGLDRAVRQVSERLPHLWERGKDRTTVEDVERGVWEALSGRSPVGQAAAATYHLDRLLDGVDAAELASLEVSVHVEKADSALGEWVRRRLAERVTADRLDVAVDDLDVQRAGLVFKDELEIPSEVDEFWRIFRTDILPWVQPGKRVFVEALLSEAPPVRAAITRQVTEELAAAGVAPGDIDVTVLSAYKQGYSWLYDAVRPVLQGRAVDRIVIRFAELGPPEEWPQQAMYTPTRWLLEIYPIDDVLARELGIDVDRITFEKMPVGSPAYEVVATAEDGSVVYEETFEPRVVVRPYFDRFPDYERVRVTTGWITAAIGAELMVDQRIVTDVERFWDHFQSETLARIYEYVMRNGEGAPRASDAPHFGELRVEVTLSEPDYQVGVDMEQVASMEALHEEIYFGTLHFFDVLGRLARGQALDYPGRVIPVVRATADGAPGRATITFTGFDAPRPGVRVAWRGRDGRQGEAWRDILPVAMERPVAAGADVRAGVAGIERLDFQLEVDFPDDRRDELVLRTSARNVDGRITSAAQVTAMLDHVRALRDDGLYRGHLAFEGLGAIGVAAYWTHAFDPDSSRLAVLPANGSPPPHPAVDGLRPAGYRWAGEELVQWDTPIPPPEAAEVLARMATFPHATVYQVGTSYLGKRIWAMDLMAPLEASHWSQAKATALKPTVVYSARQHANEVSSTSHVLELAERILTDTAYADVLDRVNVVIHPITNPDGAQLAYDLYRITPDHMLHAGYLGALGVDVTAGQNDDDPLYPETRVRPALWRTWLPDLFLNPHGYPSHEWVQLFSEYAGWVRTRASEARGWWGMRGWFMPSFGYVDSPEFPHHKAAAFEIRERITDAINGLPAIRALNERAYDRYRRYAFAFDTDNFKMDFTNGVLIYTSITGSSGRGGGVMSNPRVTVWSGTTEAPDETAHGEWLRLVASAGLAWDTALLRYLEEGDHRIERTHEAVPGGVAFKVHRPRPARPADASGPDGEGR